MNKINWKVRFNNPVWWAQIALAVIGPILAYFGLMWKDITTWGTLINLLFDAVKNPVVFVSIIVSVFNALNDPTTKGLGDSEMAKTYMSPF
ncbi:phage holin [Anaerovorax odorimutans]|uniref:phage holin n=1 Tax=Anaerovorax odorimutans TaxID=109327 RepID=UPI00042085BA|nr:phage holin [Anaerovorax odorimutans]